MTTGGSTTVLPVVLKSNSYMNIARFRKKPILGILRGIPKDSLEILLETIVKSGLETIEFAMNTQGAPSLIRKAARCYGQKLMIGAGTVLSMADLKTALKAGATFIVSPVVIPPVIQYCVKNKIPVFPGALIPSDIYTAWQLGATMVKVFPASCFGPGYFKDIKGPFPQIELLACNGVTPENMKAYFKNGASAIAVGSSVFHKDWIASKKFYRIHRKIAAYFKQLAAL